MNLLKAQNWIQFLVTGVTVWKSLSYPCKILYWWYTKRLNWMICGRSCLFSNAHVIVLVSIATIIREIIFTVWKDGNKRSECVHWKAPSQAQSSPASVERWRRWWLAPAPVDILRTPAHPYDPYRHWHSWCECIGGRREREKRKKWGNTQDRSLRKKKRQKE